MVKFDSWNLFLKDNAYALRATDVLCETTLVKVIKMHLCTEKFRWDTGHDFLNKQYWEITGFSVPSGPPQYLNLIFQDPNLKYVSISILNPFLGSMFKTISGINYRIIEDLIGKDGIGIKNIYKDVDPRDGGVCWAAVYGVAQSRTWLKRLSSSSSHCIGEWRWVAKAT